MYDAIDFNKTISNMTDVDLATYEKETYVILKDTTIKYINFVKYNYDVSLEYLMKESQEDFFMYLLAIRDMMFKRGLAMPDRFPHKFLLSVMLLKVRKGL